MGRLDEKVALITGGARGMGKAHVRHFVAEGARVVFGDVLDDKGAYVAAGLGDDVCRYVHHDVTNEADWAAAVVTAIEAFGRLDVLVNNAGVLTFGSIADMPVAETVPSNAWPLVAANRTRSGPCPGSASARSSIRP